MKKTSKLISILLAVAMLLSMAPISAFAAETVASGNCGAEGNNATWILDSDGVLTVSGTGSLGSYTYFEPAPWNDYRESIQKVIVSEGITSIGSGAFRLCENLTEASLPSTLTDVGQYSFFMCSSLKRIDIPYGVTTIGKTAFFECTALEEVTLPSGLTSIGEDVFYGCESLAEITIPNSVTTLGEYVFYDCKALKKATFSNKLTSIPDYAFSNCSSLEEVTLHDGVTSIGIYAFEECTALAKVSLPNSVTIIGDSAFSTCSNLTEIDLPDNLQSLDYGTFRSCSKLTEVIIPPSVTSIGSTFMFCTGLLEVTIPNSVTSIDGSAFSGCSSLVMVNVPCEWDGTLYTFASDVIINQHNWTKRDGVCTDCKYECPHVKYTANICDVCGVIHTHSFEYTAESDGRIVETCVEDSCTLENGIGGTVTISAPADLYADGITAKEAIVENNLVDTSVAISYIIYSAPYGLPPKDAGTYTASVTVGGATATIEYTLVKRNTTADMFLFTPPGNLIYDGTAKYATVEVSPEITGMGEITVSYYQNGEAVEPVNAGTYTVKVSVAESDKYYAINELEIASFTIKKKNVTVKANDASKIYGEAEPESFGYSYNLSYPQYKLNGQPARTPGENVGVYEIGQGTITNENNPNFNITFISGSFTIEPDTAGIDALTVANVKTSDKAAVEAVKAQIDNAVTDLADDETKAEYQAIADKCDELLAAINDTTEEIKRINDAVEAYDISTVTGNDVPALAQLADDVNALLGTDNLTAEEREALVQNSKDIQSLISRYDRVSAQLGSIKDRLNGYDNSTVKSSDKADIEQLKADIKELTDGQNLTAEEREYLVNADATCDELLAKIAETAAEYERVVALANSYDTETVTSADKDALMQLHLDIFSLALTQNVTDNEKLVLMSAHGNVFNCVERVTYVSEEIKRIVEELEKYVFESVKSDDKADIEQLVTDIKALTDTQNITEDERALLENSDETCDKLIAKIDETVAEINRINDATNAYDEATVTSDDKSDIEKLIADIKVLTDGDNITADERNQLEDNESTLNALLDKIVETAEEIERVEDAVNSYGEETVKSTDKEDLGQLKDDIQSVIDGGNITENEKTALEDMIKDIEGLEDKIEEIEQQLEDIGDFEEGFNSETVTSDDKAEIEETIAEIENANPDNLTPEQKAEYDEIKSRLEALLEEIAVAEKAVADIGAELEMFDEERVTIFWEDEIEALKAKIDEALADENMGEAEKAKLDEYKAKCDNLTETIHTPVRYFSLRLFYLIWDCLTWKYHGILLLFSRIFG